MLQRIAWLILAVVHLMPALAAIRPSLITRLYAVSPGDPAFLLIQHRAALFVAVVVVCVWAAVDIDVRRVATAVAAISMGSFLLLYWQAGSPPPLRTIALVDLAALPVLAFVAWGALRAA